jgi:hypothetical protein
MASTYKPPSETERSVASASAPPLEALLDLLVQHLNQEVDQRLRRTGFHGTLG